MSNFRLCTAFYYISIKSYLDQPGIISVTKDFKIVGAFKNGQKTRMTPDQSTAIFFVLQGNQHNFGCMHELFLEKYNFSELMKILFVQCPDNLE